MSPSSRSAGHVRGTPVKKQRKANNINKVSRPSIRRVNNKRANKTSAMVNTFHFGSKKALSQPGTSSRPSSQPPNPMSSSSNASGMNPFGLREVSVRLVRPPMSQILALTGENGVTTSGIRSEKDLETLTQVAAGVKQEKNYNIGHCSAVAKEPGPIVDQITSQEVDEDDDSLERRSQNAQSNSKQGLSQPGPSSRPSSQQPNPMSSASTASGMNPFGLREVSVRLVRLSISQILGLTGESGTTTSGMRSGKVLETLTQVADGVKQEKNENGGHFSAVAKEPEPIADQTTSQEVDEDDDDLERTSHNDGDTSSDQTDESVVIIHDDRIQIGGVTLDMETSSDQCEESREVTTEKGSQNDGVALELKTSNEQTKGSISNPRDQYSIDEFFAYLRPRTDKKCDGSAQCLFGDILRRDDVFLILMQRRDEILSNDYLMQNHSKEEIFQMMLRNLHALVQAELHERTSDRTLVLVYLSRTC